MQHLQSENINDKCIWTVVVEVMETYGKIFSKLQCLWYLQYELIKQDVTKVKKAKKDSKKSTGINKFKSEKMSL